MNPNITQTPTMELRDYMALQVLNGLLSTHRGVPFPTIVRESYEIADMMLEQRNKESK